MKLQPVTIGTTHLGSRDSAGIDLALGLLNSPFDQIDTSNNYGDGKSEQVLGKAIRELGGLPEGKKIFTKVDRDPKSEVFDYDRVMRSVDESLTRLGIDYVPILHFHDPYVLEPHQALRENGPVTALLKLKDEGVAGKIGIAMGTVELIEEYIRSGKFDAILSHNRYSVLDRTSNKIMDMANARDMLVFNAAPFGGGLLAGKEGSRYGYKPATPEFLEFVERFVQLCAKYNVSRSSAALQFSLREERIDSTVVGIYSIERLNELESMQSQSIPKNFWNDLDELGAPPVSGIDYR